jgi:hypothetical protein
MSLVQAGYAVLSLVLVVTWWTAAAHRTRNAAVAEVPGTCFRGSAVLDRRAPLCRRRP